MLACRQAWWPRTRTVRSLSASLQRCRAHKRPRLTVNSRQKSQHGLTKALRLNVTEMQTRAHVIQTGNGTFCMASLVASSVTNHIWFTYFSPCCSPLQCTWRLLHAPAWQSAYCEFPRPGSVIYRQNFQRAALSSCRAWVSRDFILQQLRAMLNWNSATLALLSTHILAWVGILVLQFSRVELLYISTCLQGIQYNFGEHMCRALPTGHPPNFA